MATTAPAARASRRIAAAAGRTLLTELESKRVLSTYGIPTVETRFAASADEAVSLAGKMLGNVLITKQTGPDGRRVVFTATLQRHLAAEGISFKSVLNDARMGLARTYLDEGRLPIGEIAFVLGFADVSAFSRAFKRWTGRSPRAYGARRR